jgi:hypothetical protein
MVCRMRSKEWGILRKVHVLVAAARTTPQHLHETHRRHTDGAAIRNDGMQNARAIPRSNECTQLKDRSQSHPPYTIMAPLTTAAVCLTQGGGGVPSANITSHTHRHQVGRWKKKKKEASRVSLHWQNPLVQDMRVIQCRNIPMCHTPLPVCHIPVWTSCHNCVSRRHDHTSFWGVPLSPPNRYKMLAWHTSEWPDRALGCCWPASALWMRNHALSLGSYCLCQTVRSTM